MIKKSLNNYKYSIILLFGTILFVSLKSPLDSIYSLRLNFFWFVIAGLGGLIAAFSFLLPYTGLSMILKKNPKGILKHILKYVFFDCMGESSQEFMLKKLGLTKKYVNTIKLADLWAILLISYIFYGFNNIIFFRIATLLGTIFVLLATIIWGIKISIKQFIGLTFFTVLRYPLELAKILPMLLAVNFWLPFPSIVLFLTTSSILYFFPFFKSGGGLFALYMVILALSLGLPAYVGLFVAIMFRLNAVLFYIIPYIVVKGWKND